MVVWRLLRAFSPPPDEMPSARSFAIRVRNVGSGAVEGSSSRQASSGGHSRPHRDVFANRKGGV